MIWTRQNMAYMLDHFVLGICNKPRNYQGNEPSKQQSDKQAAKLASGDAAYVNSNMNSPFSH